MAAGPDKGPRTALHYLRAVMQEESLDVWDRALLLAILTFADADFRVPVKFTPNITNLAIRAKMSERETQKRMKRLVKRGFIRRTPRTGRTSLLALIPSAFVAPVSDQTPAPGAPPIRSDPRTGCTPTPAPGAGVWITPDSDDSPGSNEEPRPTVSDQTPAPGAPPIRSDPRTGCTPTPAPGAGVWITPDSDDSPGSNEEPRPTVSERTPAPGAPNLLYACSIPAPPLAPPAGGTLDRAVWEAVEEMRGDAFDPTVWEAGPGNAEPTPALLFDDWLTWWANYGGPPPFAVEDRAIVFRVRSQAVATCLEEWGQDLAAATGRRVIVAPDPTEPWQLVATALRHNDALVATLQDAVHRRTGARKRAVLKTLTRLVDSLPPM